MTERRSEQAGDSWSMNCWSRKEFAEIWVMKWAELLQIRSTNQVSYKAMLLYYNWLQDKIASNVPIDEMVQELLGARRHVQESGDELLPERDATR